MTGQYGRDARGNVYGRRVACEAAREAAWPNTAPRRHAHAPTPQPLNPPTADRPPLRPSSTPSMNATLNQLSIFHYKKIFILIHYMHVFTILSHLPLINIRIMLNVCFWELGYRSSTPDVSPRTHRGIFVPLSWVFVEWFPERIPFQVKSYSHYNPAVKATDSLHFKTKKKRKQSRFHF